jgi:ATP-dependent DNA helicase DinG
MPSIIALDLETTGLNPETDAIIEIGAVRFSGRRIEEEFSTLVNPARHIPTAITQLTGINDEMVRNAPSVAKVLPSLVDFIGNDVILGHNIGFDLSFLRRHKILLENESMDTYDMAAVLLPASSRYSLGALAISQGVLYAESHRALEDARTTAKLYAVLYEKCLQLPIDLVAEFVRLSEPFDWGAFLPFQQALRTLSKNPVGPRQVKDRERGPLFPASADLFHAPLTPRDPPIPLDVDEMAALLEYGGPFSRFFENYESRTQQVEMIRAVSQALDGSIHLMVEAGTGTGKSFAYLVPSAMWALQNNQRVVISTNTINLQDQLIKKDIPDLKNALGLEVRAIVLKGRSNYLCPRRLEALRHHGPANAEEMRVLAKILVWLEQGGSGDRNEINLTGPIEREIWRRLSAEDEGCKAEVCTGRMGGTCPYFQVHQAAESAHIIVVNHALLLADVATGSRVLPDYQYLVVDEAHHMESATTNALSYRLTQPDLVRLMRELGGISSGTLGQLAGLLKEILPPSDFALAHQLITRATDLAFRLSHDFGNFFQEVEQFLLDRREGNAISQYGQQERIIPSTRKQQIWENVEIAWTTADDTLKLLLTLLTQLYKSVTEIKLPGIPDEMEDLQGELSNHYRRLAEMQTHLNGMVNDPNPNFIYWVEVNGNRNQLSIQIAPLHIGPLMEQYLWHEKSCVIMTSATLTAEGRFDYMRSRLNADEAEELFLGSPFDYESSAMLYLANDIPEPSDRVNYQKMVERTLINLSKATGGRLLALFTSYAQLKQTSQAINPYLSDAGISVFEQGEGASANTLLESFKTTEKAVLLGTRAFWEGVDVPGDALSVLVIVKLPFDVPSDPIIAARSETFEDPFNEYSLPEAILRFRQGFGRLIRTQGDRGIVVILDRRIMTKFYGKAFIDSLPECTVKMDSINRLPDTAARWLNL